MDDPNRCPGHQDFGPHEWRPRTPEPDDPADAMQYEVCRHCNAFRLGERALARIRQPTEEDYCRAAEIERRLLAEVTNAFRIPADLL